MGDIMLFSRNIEPSCAYCRFGTALGNSEVACVKRGIMAGFGFCGAFRYEPTKREPQALQDFNTSALSEEDFAL